MRVQQVLYESEAMQKYTRKGTSIIMRCFKNKKITVYMCLYFRTRSSRTRGNKMLDFLEHFGNQNHTSAWVIISNYWQKGC